MKLVILAVLFLSLVILSATVIGSHDVFAKSKFDRQVNKAIDKFSDKKHWGDICSVVATKQNNDNKQIDNSKCKAQPPVNKKPVIQPINQINARINETVNVNATITDDGIISLVVWSQNSGPQASFISSNNSFWFIPAVNGTYEFQVKATDNGGLSSTEKFTVVVGSSNPNPNPEPCPVGTHLENGVCVPDPQPPQPTNVTKIAIVGDLSGSTVLNKIKSAKVDNAFILGDYYQSTASGINSYLGQVKQIAPVVNCLLGNHEASNEDGNSQVEQATLSQCGDHWSLNIGKVGFIGFNSNGNLDASVIDIPKNVSSMVIMSHKPCQATPPNSHHPLESSVVKFCNDLKQRIDSNIKLYFVNGHNHVASNNADKTIFTSGAGGRSHYTCGTSAEFPFCNNQAYGYLRADIDKVSGDISFHFYDTNGKLLN